ncbi:hypothetical protein ACGRHY_26880 [Streptomyces sp. HK10]|uniref:hypothetical protein n=1 Tax=Streptomyces sp. HK10 TaxID=3373255 RepID=UPI00374A324F
MDQQKPVLEEVPVGMHFDYPADQPVTTYEQDRRELLGRYTSFAQGRGRLLKSYLIRPAGSTDQLVVELFDATHAQLVVTCATLQRGGPGVWYAMGTLADLARFLPSPARNVLVLPTEPDSDLDGLCTIRSIMPVWPGTDGFTSHLENEPPSDPIGEPPL